MDILQPNIVHIREDVDLKYLKCAQEVLDMNEVDDKEKIRIIMSLTKYRKNLVPKNSINKLKKKKYNKWLEMKYSLNNHWSSGQLQTMAKELKVTPYDVQLWYSERKESDLPKQKVEQLEMKHDQNESALQ